MQNQAGPNQTSSECEYLPALATYTKTVAIDSRRFQIYSHFCSAVWLYRKNCVYKTAIQFYP